MANISQLIERFFQPQPLDYTHQDGNILYLDGSALERPQKMPRTHKLIALAFVVVGVILGVSFVNSTVLETAREATPDQATIDSNLAREASLATVPNLANLAAMSDDDILNSLDQAGYTVYNMTAEGDSGINLYKLPSDVSVTDAVLLLSRDIGSLNAAQATQLLNGSWNLNTSRDNGYTIVVRYADFNSTTVENAVSQAITHEGIDPATSTETGTDDSGNFYNQGKLEANGTTYTWRVSAIQLKTVYNISGLPNAFYVGIRLTQAS